MDRTGQVRELLSKWGQQDALTWAGQVRARTARDSGRGSLGGTPLPIRETQAWGDDHRLSVSIMLRMRMSVSLDISMRVI